MIVVFVNRLIGGRLRCARAIPPPLQPAPLPPSLSVNIMAGIRFVKTIYTNHSIHPDGFCVVLSVPCSHRFAKT